MRVAIDDFGTGYSSLSRLRTLPADIVKIDQSFVSEIVDRKSAVPLVTSTINMAHGLGLQVVAEGIETPHQLAFLTERAARSGRATSWVVPCPLISYTPVGRNGHLRLSRSRLVEGQVLELAHPGWPVARLKGYAVHDGLWRPSPTRRRPMPQRPEPLLPLGLRLRGRRVVVVGGGPVGLRRVGALLAADALVTLVAPRAVAALEDLAGRGQILWNRRPYESGDLHEAWLAMACTADPAVNAAVLAAADEARIFCLRADDASGASAWMPATGRSGRATVSVHGDRDPQTAAALRDVALAAVEGALRRDPRVRTRRRAQAGGSGRVVLVGGGPGDPGLLTLKGFQALADADVVVVDRLAPLAVLDGLGEAVEIIDVSKIPRGRFTPQEDINDVLVRQARQGRVVVRFKGGDSFVFGRGMEEVLACQEAGVPVEVIPGVTSAVAAPELAGIPLTHRGISPGFTVVTGHLAPGHPGSTLDWAALAHSGTTLVVLMGVENLAPIVGALLDAGRTGDTPVACVMDGGLPTQNVVLTSLATIAGQGPPPELHSPAVAVIGAVAAFAAG